jgi:AcrR family transcriptional regulator
MPVKPAPKKIKPKRRRLSAEDARASILAAAAQKLTRVGPERLRLNELAAELGITHQAILHHFGSREELVSAVLGRAILQSTQELAEIIEAGGEAAPRAALDLAREYFGTQGRARLLAWLVLSERAPELNELARSQQAMAPLLELVHKQRQLAHPGKKLARADTQFACELAACAMLGEALFGPLIRLSFGPTAKASDSSDFQARLAALLASQV